VTFFSRLSVSTVVTALCKANGVSDTHISGNIRKAVKSGAPYVAETERTEQTSERLWEAFREFLSK